MPRPKVAVIVVAYNGRADLERCLPSVSAATQSNHQRSVILVDNASADASADFAESQPGVEVVRQVKNLGFAAGNNVALRLALERGYDYAVLLNQDTIVATSWLDELVAAAEANPDAGAIQSLLTLWPNAEVSNSWGNKVQYLGFGFAGGYSEPVASAPMSICEITYPSGAAVLLRCSTLRSIGLLDEFLFMYHEDLDLGWRMWLSGWRVLLAPRSVVHHAFVFSKSKDKFYLMERNRWLVLLTHWRLPTILLLLPMLLIMELGQLLFSARRGEFFKRLSLYPELLSPKTLSYLRTQREAVQQLRRSPDKAFLERCSATISYQEIQSPLLRLANPIMAAYFWLVRLLVQW